MNFKGEFMDYKSEFLFKSIKFHLSNLDHFHGRREFSYVLIASAFFSEIDFYIYTYSDKYVVSIVKRGSDNYRSKNHVFRGRFLACLEFCSLYYRSKLFRIFTEILL